MKRYTRNEIIEAMKNNTFLDLGDHFAYSKYVKISDCDTNNDILIQNKPLSHLLTNIYNKDKEYIGCGRLGVHVQVYR